MDDARKKEEEELSQKEAEHLDKVHNMEEENMLE